MFRSFVVLVFLASLGAFPSGCTGDTMAPGVEDEAWPPFLTQRSTELGQFGVTLETDADGWFVAYVEPGTDADLIGFESGQRIEFVDGRPARDLSFEDLSRPVARLVVTGFDASFEANLVNTLPRMISPTQSGQGHCWRCGPSPDPTLQGCYADALIGGSSCTLGPPNGCSVAGSCVSF